MAKVELELPQEMADCVDWLVGREESTRDHVLLALINNALVMARDAIDDEDYELMSDQLALTMKRYFRAEAPEIWARRDRP